MDFSRQLLSRYRRLETRHVDELAETLTRLLGPHKAEPSRSGAKFAARLNAKALTDISLSCLAVSGSITARASAFDSSYLFRARWCGESEIRFDRETLIISRECSALLSPGDVVEMRTSEYSEGLGMRIKESAMIREMENCLGHPLTTTLRFDPAMNMQAVFAQRFWEQTLGLCQELDRCEANGSDRVLAIQQKERDLVSLLINGQRHNYTRLLHRQTAAAPWQVRAVEEYVHAHAEEPLSLGELCRIAGVNARTLQFSFQRHRGCSPMRFLRTMRLDRVRMEILYGEEPQSVSEIATKWGFMHLGRFAADYAKRFGETPSASQRRAKTSRALSIA